MTQRNRMLKTTMILTIIIVISKIVGFLRERMIAATFAQSLEKSAYDFSDTVVMVVSMFFIAGISSTFIPIYTKTRLHNGEEEASRYASHVLNLYIICAILASALAYFLAPQLSGLLWSGSAEGVPLMTQYLRILAPSLVFWAIAGVLISVLNARKHFIPEQLMGFALSICVMLSIVLFGTMRAVVIATSVAAVMQVCILLPFMRKRFRYHKGIDLKNDDLKRTFLLAAPAFVTVSFDMINNLADKYFASGISDSAVSALRESYSVVMSALGLLVVPITTVMFSELAVYAAKKEMDQLKATVRKSIEIVALITLPVIAIAFVLQNNVIAMFYENGRYGPGNTAYTAPIFAFYIIGIFAFGARNFLTRVFYSLQKTKIPMFIGIAAVVINIVLDFLLKDALGVKGLTLATTIAGTFGAIAMIIVLRKTLGRMDFKKSAGQFLRILVCAAACAGMVLWLNSMVPVFGTGFLNNLARIVVCGGAGLLLYGALAWLLKVETMGKLLGIIKNKLMRQKET